MWEAEETKLWEEEETKEDISRHEKRADYTTVNDGKREWKEFFVGLQTADKENELAIKTLKTWRLNVRLSQTDTEKD